jgi:hypothetical protein
VEAEAVEGPLDRVIISIIGHAGEAAAEGGAGEPTGLDRQAVDQPESRAGRQLGRETLLDQLLDAPEVGRLAHEGGAVDAGQRRELGGVVAAEVADEVAVLAQTPELADELDGDDLAVGEGGVGASLSEPGQVEGLHFVIHEAEDME